MMTSIFWLILGLGTALPFSLVVIFNLLIKLRNPDNYDLNIGKLAWVYILALLGWAITFGVR